MTPCTYPILHNQWPCSSVTIARRCFVYFFSRRASGADCVRVCVCVLMTMNRKLAKPLHHLLASTHTIIRTYAQLANLPHQYEEYKWHIACNCSPQSPYTQSVYNIHKLQTYQATGWLLYTLDLCINIFPFSGNSLRTAARVYKVYRVYNTTLRRSANRRDICCQRLPTTPI